MPAMTIWILALLLFTALAAVGYNQGAIRVSFSLLGLIVSSFLAMPVSKATTPLVRWLLALFDNHNPLLVGALAPVAAFILLLILFKIAGLAVHKQVEVYFKYKAGDLRLALWERMNKRIGACLGIANGLVYTVLIALVCYVISYGTTQMGLNDSAPKLARLITRMGQDVVATGLVKVVRAIDPTPPVYYEAVDIVGLIYHNPLTQGRLTRYPAFLGLSQRPEFQELANDKDYYEMLVRQAPIMEVINHPKTQVILNNPVLLHEIWGLISSDLKDFRGYIETGNSAKYDTEPLLGYWTFDLGSSFNQLKRTQPPLGTVKLKELRKYLQAAYTKTILLATPERTAYLKDVISIRPGTLIKPETLTQFEKKTGTWENSNGKYSFSGVFPDSKDLTATIANGKLIVTGSWSPLVFIHEN